MKTPGTSHPIFIAPSVSPLPCTRGRGVVGGLMKTKEGVHPRIVALGLPSPPPWAQKPLQNKLRRGGGVTGQIAVRSVAFPPPPPPPPSSAFPSPPSPPLIQ